jgi:hypothetical protein
MPGCLIKLAATVYANQPGYEHSGCLGCVPNSMQLCYL